MLYKKITLIIIFFIAVLVGILLFNLPKPQQKAEHKIYALKFDDLPEAEKEKYVSKNDLFEYGEYITPKSYAQNFSVSFDKNLSQNTDELHSQIKELLAKNEILIKDNIDISEKNLDLIAKLNEAKNSLKAKNQTIQSQNDEALKAQEAQHLKNIKEITDRLNLAQNENLQSVKEYEKKIAKLENEILNLNTNYDKNVSEILSQKDSQILSLQATNEALKNELNRSFEDKNLSKNEINLTHKEIRNLQNELELNKKEIESLKFINKREIERINSGYNTQKIALEDELSKKSNMIIDLKNELKISNEKITQNQKQSDELLKNNEILKDELKAFVAEISKLKEIILKQEANLKSSKDESINLDKNSKILANELNEKTLKIKNLESNLTELNDELNTLKTASKTDMRNYEILKSQINELKKSDDLSLKNEILELKIALDERDRKINELKNSKGVATNSELLAQINELEAEINSRLDKEDNLEDENTNLKKILESQTNPEVPKKLVFVSKIECEDVANNKVSTICKNRVSDFLSRYNSNYLYEVIAIVDERGYSLPYEIASKISKSELARLNGYVDFGVGKERANLAAGLIKDEFGEFSRISYSSEVIKKSNARGFIIKVYR